MKKSFEETAEIKRNWPVRYLVVEPEHLKLKYKTKEKKGNKETEKRTNRKRKRQLGDFLNCYNFAYAGRHTVN